MGSSVSVCSASGVWIYDSAPSIVDPFGSINNPVDSINKSITPTEFAAIWSSRYPSYALNHFGNLGSTALHQAARTGNIPIIEYIVHVIEKVARDQLGTKRLLNLGDRKSHTSLFFAIQYNQRSAARTLIRCGAEVNMACPDAPLPRMPTDKTYRTPLSLVIEGNTFLRKEERAQKVAMAKLLLIHKGIVDPKPKTTEGIEILEEAEKELGKIESTLLIALRESTPARDETIQTIISYVPLDEVPDIPETPVSVSTGIERYLTGFQPMQQRMAHFQAGSILH